MRRSPRHRLAAVLGGVATEGSFSTRLTAPVNDLNISVRGVGSLPLPVPAARARELRLIARPAKYGRGEATLLDRAVRDSWDVPLSRVKIDKRRWNKTLLPSLDQIARDLGVSDGCSLKAALHSMLVYEPGQFFAPHQDSEKADDMIGTLVVILPSNARGGELVIEHQGGEASYQASRTSLTLVAFYADTLHQIRPVTSGYRVALTYSLMLAGGANEAAGSAVPPAVAAELSDHLEAHFLEPADVPSWRHDLTSSDPPDRLVYLLDHEYTERGLGWGQLKGDDAPRANMLRSTATDADCHAELVQADVHETWDCQETDWRYSRSHRWQNDHRGSLNEGDELGDLDGYELGDLIEADISLYPTDNANRRPAMLHAEDHELCESTPSIKLKPYESQYEGYMGNYGNTMDRWYRRAAVVVWPRRREFVVMAKADPGAALDELLANEVDGEVADLSKLREKVGSLSPFWDSIVRADELPSLLPKVLRVGYLVDEPVQADMLLQPFPIELLDQWSRCPSAMAWTGWRGG